MTLKKILQLLSNLDESELSELRRVLGETQKGYTGVKKKTGKTETYVYKPSREHPYVMDTWTCEICGKTHTRERLASRKPKYCPPVDGKPSDCQKEANRRRVAFHRANKKSME